MQKQSFIIIPLKIFYSKNNKQLKQMLRPRSAIILSIPPSFAQTKDVVRIKAGIRKCFKSDSQQFDQPSNKSCQNTKIVPCTYKQQVQKLALKYNNCFTEVVHNVVYKTRHQYSQSLCLTDQGKSAINRSCTYSFMNTINKSYQCSGLASSVVKRNNRTHYMKNSQIKGLLAPKKISKKSSCNLIKQLQKARMYHALLQQKKNQIYNSKHKHGNKEDLQKIQNNCLLIKKISRFRKNATQFQKQKYDAEYSSKTNQNVQKKEVSVVNNSNNSNMIQNKYRRKKDNKTMKAHFTSILQLS